MALDSNSNLNPRQTLTKADLASIIKEVLGEVMAEQLLDARKQEQKAADDPAAIVKANERASYQTPGSIKRASRDDLAVKDVEEMTQHEKALMFARWAQCAAQAHHSHRDIVEIAKRAGQETLAKAMQAQDFDGGGFMLEPAFANAVIAELLPNVVYTSAGPTPLDLPEGGMVLPYESDGADAQWTGEGIAVNAEEVTGGQIRMQPHKLITIAGVSNDLLRAKPGQADAFILDSIMRNMRTKLDSTLLRSLGVSSEPMGLRGLVASANEFNVTSKTGLTQAILVREVLKCLQLIETANVNVASERPAYFTSPRIKYFLKAQRATDGLLFPGLEAAQGTLFGVPLYSTSNIPTNLDHTGSAANDESELYCAAMALMVLGRTVDMQVDVFPGGSYNDSSGTNRSGISTDETPIRVIGKWDHVAKQRGNEISLANELDWAL